MDLLTICLAYAEATFIAAAALAVWSVRRMACEDIPAMHLLKCIAVGMLWPLFGLLLIGAAIYSASDFLMTLALDVIAIIFGDKED